MIDLENTVALLVAAPMGAAYVCRLDALSWRTAKPTAVGFHLAALLYLAGCGTTALSGQPLGHEWLGMAVCGLWLVQSWPTWRHGPPAHVRTEPVPLDAEPESRLP